MEEMGEIISWSAFSWSGIIGGELGRGGTEGKLPVCMGSEVGVLRALSSPGVTGGRGTEEGVRGSITDMSLEDPGVRVLAGET